MSEQKRHVNKNTSTTQNGLIEQLRKHIWPLLCGDTEDYYLVEKRSKISPGKERMESIPEEEYKHRK